MPQPFIAPIKEIISEEPYKENEKEYVKVRYIYDFYGGPFEETRDFTAEKWAECKKAGIVVIIGF